MFWTMFVIGETVVTTWTPLPWAPVDEQAPSTRRIGKATAIRRSDMQAAYRVLAICCN